MEEATGADLSSGTRRPPAADLRMTDVGPLLKRWWSLLQRLAGAAQVNAAVLQQLFRREAVLGAERGAEALSGAELQAQWLSAGRSRWLARDPAETVRVVRELVDFQAEVGRGGRAWLRGVSGMNKDEKDE